MWKVKKCMHIAPPETLYYNPNCYQGEVISHGRSLSLSLSPCQWGPKKQSFNLVVSLNYYSALSQTHKLG